MIAALAMSPAIADTATAAKADGITSAAKVEWLQEASKYKADEKVVIGSLDLRTDYLFQLELVNEYASIRTLKLSGYFSDVKDKMAFDADPDGYTSRVKAKQEKNPAASDGRYCLLKEVVYEGRKTTTRHLPLATTKIQVKVGDAEEFTPLEILRWEMLKKTAVGDGNSESQSFRWEGARRGLDGEVSLYLRITKTYTVTKKDATVVVSLKFENLSDEKLTIQVDQRGPTGVPREDPRADMRSCVYGVMDSEENVEVLRKDRGALEALKLNTEQSLGKSDSKEPTLWVGQTNKFFGSMMYLRPEVTGRLQAANYGAQFFYASGRESEKLVTQLTGVSVPALQLAPKTTRSMVLELYAGPKKQSTFSEKSDPQFNPLYAKLNYKDTITFGGCFCAIPGLASGMMWLLSFLSSMAFGNYGIAIFILVILVRVVLHPLTKKGQVSMMKMQKMGPEMERVKKKYADDKDTLNKEMVKLYKEQGATPILGCLPMLLQLPIWVALYGGLNALVELRHAAFLPVWITDLAGPDALFRLPMDIPLVGDTFNLLPILLCVAMYFQTKYGPQSASASPEQQKSQAMMKYMMPVMMLMFFYHAPSGLNLYIMTSTAASVIEQLVIRKHMKAKEDAEALLATVIDIPGKRSRDTREKKPKGPNWTKRG